MQRVTPQGRNVRTVVALFAAVTATFLTSAAVGGSTQSAPGHAAYLCPPAC